MCHPSYESMSCSFDPKLSTLERYAQALGQSITVIADTGSVKENYSA